MHRSRVIVAVAVAVAVVVLGAGTVWFLRRGEDPGDTAERYLAAWTRGDLAAMKALVDKPPGDFEQRLTRMREEMTVTAQRYRVASMGDADDGEAKGAYAAELTLAGNRSFAYDGTMTLVERDGEWRVRWSPQLLHPELEEGHRLRTARDWPDRAPVLAADGSVLSDSPSGSARQLAGPLGTASAEAARELGPPYREGDAVGADGLHRQYERRLAGTPALAVQIVDAENREVKTLHRFGGADGEPLRTTIDPKVQAAAGEALADAEKPASMVALRASTGEILAVANKPGGYNRALMGQYPPGSTFKVVTAAALVAEGVGVNTRVPCPATTTIGGRSFRNYENEDFGRIPFREAFAHSCNTTFARLAVDRLGQKRLAEVAGQFGFNVPIIAGLPAVRAAFPGNEDDAAFASASFGQGKVLTSPLNMASVAAAAASGTWHSPRLVDASLASQALDAKGRKPVPPKKLEPAVRRALQALMPAVVSEGTAADVGFPSGTAGKTGTAEFGSGEEPPTHAWFIGYRGDIAFAVIVEDGGTGAEAAAPIAAKFLKRL
ncbi:MAG TPA: penicillin-binding transpeptidase domain-containing protein [Vulgatibacteraceae bacterium]|nr:penicillin-binding transpeptidase domain-containing protein [Vulgatibacteraceae bacterium]